MDEREWKGSTLISMTCFKRGPQRNCWFIRKEVYPYAPLVLKEPAYHTKVMESICQIKISKSITADK